MRRRDRGTDRACGYSSFRYLQTFPFDQLKIDGSFVRGEGDGLASGAIVTMLIALGRAFDVVVVAEGVETQRQLDELAALGCENVRGFLLERPLAATYIPGAIRAIEGKTWTGPPAEAAQRVRLPKGSFLTGRIRKAAHR